MEINEDIYRGKWTKHLQEKVKHAVHGLESIDLRKIKLYCKFFNPGGLFIRKEPKIAIEMRHTEYGIIGCALLAYDNENDVLRYMVNDVSGTLMTGSKHGLTLYLTPEENEWIWQTASKSWKIKEEEAPNHITEVKTTLFGRPRKINTVSYDNDTYYYTKSLTTGMELFDLHSNCILAKVSKETLWRRLLTIKPQGIYYLELDRSIDQDIALSILILAFAEKLRYTFYAAH